MKRFFSHPLLALLAGAGLRLLFALKFPAGSGDSPVYDQLAKNWLKLGAYAMDVAGRPTPVDLRMPGYPAFLALVYLFTGPTGERARLAVLLAQVVLDLGTSVAIAYLAASLARLRNPAREPKRVFLAALWLASLCPFIANYVAVPLTEVWAVLLTTLAFLLLVPLLPGPTPAVPKGPSGAHRRKLAFLAGMVIGLGTLFRPETPLLLLTACAVLLLGCRWGRGGERPVWTSVLLAAGCAVVLLPWTLRNAVTLGEFQPLAPRNTMLPGEVDPRGFLAWERTWLYRMRDAYQVSWKLNEEEIRIDDLPPWALDTPEEKERIAAVLATYNDELSWTAEEDAVFGEIARERTARHRLRTYLWIPLHRAVSIWFTPRIELLPVSGHVFPLAYQREEDPVDQQVTILFFFLNLGFLGLAVCGVFRLWPYPDTRAALALFLLYALVRTVFLTTLETPEPRYMLECFPAWIALGAQVWGEPS